MQKLGDKVGAISSTVTSVTIHSFEIRIEFPLVIRVTPFFGILDGFVPVINDEFCKFVFDVRNIKRAAIRNCKSFMVTKDHDG